MAIRIRPMMLFAVIGSAILGLKAGAVFGVIVVDDVPDRRLIVSAFAIAGALFGGMAGAGLVRATGWLMILGAFLGGILAIFVNGNGKAAMYGVPLGMLGGVAAGLAFEGRRKQSHDDSGVESDETGQSNDPDIRW